MKKVSQEELAIKFDRMMEEKWEKEKKDGESFSNFKQRAVFEKRAGLRDLDYNLTKYELARIEEEKEEKKAVEEKKVKAKKSK